MIYSRMDNRTPELIRYRQFLPFAGVEAFTTTKNGWPVENPRFTGDSSDLYAENRRRLAQLLEIEPGQLVFPRQTHTDCVAVIEEPPAAELKDTDALVTNRRGICLCVQTADCVPLLMYDPEVGAVAAVHAGWRGTFSRIAAQTVATLVREYGSNPAALRVAIGPSIGPADYEVGGEVAALFRREFDFAEEILTQKPDGKFLLDLWEANRRQLLEQGVWAAHIEISRQCSFRETGKFHSARREGISTGRMVSGIMLRDGNFPTH